MKKYLLVFLLSFIFILIPKSVFALEPSGMRLFYTNDQGQTLDTSSTSNQNWSGYNVKYITMGFDGGSFSSLPQVMYSGFSGYNCSSNCSITGTFMNYVPFGVTSLNTSVIVQVEAGGTYSSCSINSVSVHDNFFEKIDFTCYADSLSSGFNLVESNLAVYPDKTTYYGIAYDTLIIKENIGTSDIISNNNQNTQNIINNQNNNTQNIINNQNNNANQAHQDSQAINNTLNDDSIPTDNSSTAQSWASNNASDSVVSDMVLMPITLLNAFSNGFNGSCSSYNLGSLYGTNLILPCINIQNYLGATLWGIIDVLMSGFLIYGIGKKFVRVFNDFTNLKDSQVDELYGGGNQ